jgi:hypothetical protein
MSFATTPNRLLFSKNRQSFLLPNSFYCYIVAFLGIPLVFFNKSAIAWHKKWNSQVRSFAFQAVQQ